MNTATLLNQIDHFFLVVVTLVVVNICWAFLIMIAMKRIRILEDVTGVESKTKTERSGGIAKS